MTTDRMTRRGFTMINLLVTAAVMAVMAGMVMLTLEPNDRARVVGAAQRLASDLEYAQALSLADPDDPAGLYIDEAGEGYWIARVSDPGTAIKTPGGDAYIIALGVGDMATYAGIDLSIISGAVDGAVEFDEFGRLAELGDVRLGLALGSLRWDVVVDSSTGFVEITSGP